jgi:hypothetical protein
MRAGSDGKGLMGGEALWRKFRLRDVRSGDRRGCSIHYAKGD